MAGTEHPVSSFTHEIVEQRLHILPKRLQLFHEVYEKLQLLVSWGAHLWKSGGEFKYVWWPANILYLSDSSFICATE